MEYSIAPRDRPAPRRAPRVRKELGQHFLVDRAAVRRIVQALAPRAGEPLLEIGPGDGALTEALIEATGRIAAVELDPRWVERLARRFDPSRLVLHAGDVLALDLAPLPAALGAPADARLVIAGNLPYNISKPLVQRLIAARACVDRAVLMFQREVAARLVAGPGRRDYGPLGILAREAFTIAPLFDLPPTAFRPRPEVHSTVTLWRVRPDAPRDETLARFRRCLAACFARRRKTLRGNLRAALGDARAAALLARTGIDGRRRAEELDEAALRELAAAWDTAGV